MTGPRRTRSLALPLAVVLVGGGLLLALLGAHLRPSGYGTPAPAATSLRVTLTVPATVVPSGPPVAQNHSNRARHEIGGLLVGMYAVLVGTLLAIVGVAIVRSLTDWRPGRHALRRREPTSHAVDPPPHETVAAGVAAAASAGLDDLAAEGPVADAIIACWQRMRTAAQHAGADPVASDTPDEVVTRIAATLSGDLAPPLRRLADLYREARFSVHDMTRGDVWVARQELRTVLDLLDPTLLPDAPPRARASPGDGAEVRDDR